MMVRTLGLALVILSVVGGLSTSVAALEVLGPGQDASAVKLKSRVVGSLPEGTSVASVQIKGEALELSIASGEMTWLLSLRSPKVTCPKGQCLATGQGHLFGVNALPDKLRTALSTALADGPALLSWHTVVSKRPKTPPPKETVVPPLGLDAALQAFKDNRHDEVRTLVKPMLQDPSRAPPGALSLYLASGGEGYASLDTMLEQFPLESRLHALVAQEALAAGQPKRASRHLARALSLAPTDGLAVALAKRAGWKTEATSLGDEPALPPETPSWPWLLGYLVLALFAFECFRRRLYKTLAGLVVALVASLLLPVGESSFQEPEMVHFQLADQGASCAFESAGWIHGEFTLVARCQGKNHVLHLRAKDASGKAFASSKHHQLSLRGGSSSVLDSDAKRLVKAIEEQEQAGFRLAKPLESASAHLQANNSSQEWQLRVTFAFVLAAIWGLLMALYLSLRELAQVARTFDAGQKRLFFGALVLFFAIQFVVGGRPIMVFEGYSLTEGLAAGEIPRYGAGSLFFYGWTQWIGATDHVSLMNLNLVLGALCVALLLGWVHRLFPADPRKLVWSAVLVLSLPVIARAHGSESILVGPTAAILAALFLFAGKGAANHITAVLLLCAAALTRPEMAVVACIIPVFAQVASGRAGLPRLSVPWAGLTLLAIIAIWGAFMSASNMSARDALPATERGLGPIIAAMTVDGILTDIRCFPVALSLLGLWALTRPTLRRLALVSWLLALLWMALTGVDHTSASTPRTHLPVVFMMVPLMVAAWTAFIDSGSMYRSGAVVTLVLAGSLYSGWMLHSPNNDDAEEDLWRALVVDIQDEEACIVAMGDDDPPDRGRTSRHNPEYWVTSAHPDWKVSPLSDLPKVRRTCSGKVYALLGVRCYTQIREPGESVPDGSSMHPICSDVLKEKPARKVIEWDIENRSQMSHPMYPAGSPLKIGVYELGPRPHSP